MTPDYIRRRACLAEIARFCALEGFSVPPLVEHPKPGATYFGGRSPNGRTFVLGYERVGHHEPQWPADVRVPLRTISG